ncbi:hypothetical protein ACROYT_G010092 [Oculina patagonica]
MSQNLAVDLMLRTLMNSPEFRESENKNWEGVAKLVPGSTPQQCAKRWKEIKQTSALGIITPSLPHSSPDSKQLSSFLNSVLHFADEKESVSATVSRGTVRTNSQPAARDVNSLEEQHSADREPGHERASEVTSYQETDTESKQRSIIRQAPSARSQASSIESLQGPNMVIHVCDESKNLKQDFTCPRDLLISEMRYFAEYLSVEAQRWEEVDISVHCDVQIFDWLMKYVKRRLHEKSKSTSEEKKPRLEPNNVISILISSDFLKMDALVTECIKFCHENMSSIVATPCNMNCINDKLVTRMAKLFTHTELEGIKDRKDKFKSKLFCKKIEELFDPRFSSSSSSNASTLFRCIACGKLLTAESQGKLRCVPNRMMVNHRGKVSYVHSRDYTWDVNDYLLGLREQVKSWKEVYWRLWGTVNILYCHRCGNYFQCTELGHCSYHPMTVDYGNMECTATKIVGVYPCCQQRVLHFDPSLETSGCCVRDHKPMSSTPQTTTSENKTSTAEQADDKTDKDKTTESNEEQGQEENTGEEGNSSQPEKDKSSETDNPAGQIPDTAPAAQVTSKRHSVSQGQQTVNNNQLVVEDLLAHRGAICVPYRRLSSARSAELNVFGVEEIALASMHVRDLETNTSALSDMIDPSERKVSEFPTYLPSIRRSRSRLVHRSSLRRMKLQTANKEDDYDLGEDEDQPESEDNDLEQKLSFREKPRPPRKVTSASRKDFSTFKSYKWDSQRSARWNQDAQREEDQKRMTELVSYLTRQRAYTPQEKVESKQKPKEFLGGIFSKLDHQFRASQQAVVSKTQSSGPQTGSSQRIRKIPLKVAT